MGGWPRGGIHDQSDDNINGSVWLSRPCINDWSVDKVHASSWFVQEDVLMIKNVMWIMFPFIFCKEVY